MKREARLKLLKQILQRRNNIIERTTSRGVDHYFGFDSIALAKHYKQLALWASRWLAK